MASSMELGRRIDEFARELEEEFGELPESDEPLITRMENWAVEIGDAVMARAMERALASRSSRSGPECCPTCGRGGRRKGSRRRLLQTRRGKVAVEEVEYYCSGCRRSFFPAVQTAGD
jgi:transposase-like protein